jgi:hypothetical protein
MNTLADIQGEGKQVVGAGSIHPNGNKYEIYENYELSFISYAEIKALLIPYDKKPKKEIKEYEKPKNSNVEDDFINKIKECVSISDVLNSFGVTTAKNPTECPFHASKGGKCLGFNREVAHCFHCEGSWNIFSLVKEAKKIDIKGAIDYLVNTFNLQKEHAESRKRYLEYINSNVNNEKKELKENFLELISGKEKKISKATEILVEYIKKYNHIYTTKDDIKSEMWIYKNGIYLPQGRSEIKEVMRDILDEWYNVYYYNQVIAKIEADTYIDAEKFFKTNYPNEIPVQNGILNIFTRELKPFTPNKIFFNKMPVRYEKNATCPAIDLF